MTFTELPPQERGLIIAKIYHNIWYDAKRFEVMMQLLEKWDADPIREAKFLHEIQSETDERLDKII
jgi:hypothetical protein